MNPMEAARSVVAILSDNEKQELARELGLQLSACQRSGHKYKEVEVKKDNRWTTVMFCEKCGQTIKV